MTASEDKTGKQVINESPSAPDAVVPGSCSAKDRIVNFLKSADFWGFIVCVVIMAFLAFAYFYPDAAQGNVLRQYDTQQGIANGQEAKAFAEQTGDVSRWTNSLFSGMPTFQISPSYESNAMFDWINKVMGLGLPSPANLLVMMMLGFFIMMRALKAGLGVSLFGAIAYGFSSYFLIIIGAGHIWKFITLAYVPPTIGGIMMAYRGRWLGGSALAAVGAMMQIAANHIQMTYYFLFVIVALVIAYFVDALKKKALRQWAISTGALAVAAALAVCANLPSLYNTQQYSKLTIRGGHSELTSEASANPSPGLDRDYITQYSYQPSETFSLLIPNIKGGATIKPEGGAFKQLTLDGMDKARQMSQTGELNETSAQYISFLSQYFGDAEGTNGPVYVGAIIVAFFLLGCIIVKGPLKWALVVMTVFSIVLSWGRHWMLPTDLMIDYMPMYSKFRTVESILVIAEFTMPLLAALAVMKLLQAPRGEVFTRYRKPLSWSFGITVAICLLAIVAPGAFGSFIGDADRMTDDYISQMMMANGYPQDQLDALFSLRAPQIYNAIETLRGKLVSDDAIRSLMLVVIALGVIYLASRFKLKATPTALILAALVTLDLFSVNKRYLDHNSFVPRRLTVGAPIAKTPADEVILQDTAMNYRVMDIPRFNSADPSYYHKSIGGYHAAKLTRYQDLIDRHLGNFQQGKADSTDIAILNMLNARYIIGPDNQVAKNDDAQGNAWFVDGLKTVNGANAEMEALSTTDLRSVAVVDQSFAGVLSASAKTPGDTIFETSYAPNRLTYHARSAKGGTAVFSEVYFPWGWRATVDGQPVDIARVNYVLRAIKIPAGEHTVEMSFDPPSIRTTVNVARVSIILIYLLVAGAICRAAAGCKKKE